MLLKWPASPPLEGWCAQSLSPPTPGEVEAAEQKWLRRWHSELCISGAVRLAPRGTLTPRVSFGLLFLQEGQCGSWGGHPQKWRELPPGVLRSNRHLLLHHLLTYFPSHFRPLHKTCTQRPPGQGSANYCPLAKSSLLPVFVHCFTGM